MMRRTVMKGLFIALVAGMLADESTAAVISVQPRVAGFLDPVTFAQLPSVPPGTNPGHAVVVQVDVMMEVLSLAQGEDGFGIAAFSFELDPNPIGGGTIIADPEAGGWVANNFLVDTNGLAPGGQRPLFIINADLGLNSYDYREIEVSMTSDALLYAADPRRYIGEAGSWFGEVPFLLGSAILEWNGLGAVTITFNPMEVAAKLTTGQFVPGEAAPSATIVLGTDVPEPSSLVLVVGCLAGVVLRRRAT